MPRPRTVTLIAVVALAGGLLAAPAAATSPTARTPGLAFHGESTLAAGLTFQGTVVGGLSSLTYDAARDVYYALSDDQGAGFTPTSSPARFYTLRINLADGRLDPGDVTVAAVTTFTGPDGLPFPPLSLDPEGLTLTPQRTLVLTSEGIAAQGIAPFVREFDLSGHQIRALPVPGYYAPAAGRGVRQNLGFEAAAVAPSGSTLFVGTENALVQDGPPATVTSGSPARILRYHWSSGRLDREYVYRTGPVVAPSPVFTVNGLVELLPLNNEFLLAMERSFSVGVGNTIRIYRIALAGATDVRGIDDLDKVSGLRPAQKTLLRDLGGLVANLDNLEGMTLGPRLPDGGQSLVLVSDNNFTLTPQPQPSQFLMFELG